MKALFTSATLSIALLAGAPLAFAQSGEQSQEQPAETDDSTYSNPAASGEA